MVQRAGAEVLSGCRVFVEVVLQVIVQVQRWWVVERFS